MDNRFNTLTARQRAYLVSGALNVFGIQGQSNESGRVLHTDRAAYPRCFESLRYPGVKAPLFGVNVQSTVTSGGTLETAFGGWHFKVMDDLYDAGFGSQMIVGAIGSSGLVRHWCGGATGRGNNTKYSIRRGPSGDPDDFGYCGDITVQGGKVFLATAGCDTYAGNVVAYRASGASPTLGSPYGALDYIFQNGAAVTAGADPGGWSGVAAGGTVVDGGITWTNVDNSNSVGLVNDAPVAETFAGQGWDPLGLHTRLHNRMQRVSPARGKHILIMFGQTDGGFGATQANFRQACINAARYWLRRGYHVHLGMSCYTPTVAVGNYTNLSNGVTDALTILAGDVYSSRVHAGPNLYTALGSTGVMGTGGAYLNADNVHLNGLGALAAADVISANLIATLRSIG